MSSDDLVDSEHHSLALAYQTYLRHDDAEQEHMEDVCRSYRQYATFALCHWTNQTRRLGALSDSQKQLLPRGLVADTPEFQQRFQQFKEAAIHNQFCLDCILKHAGMPHSQQTATESKIVGDNQISKVSSVLKSLARDWSSEGKAERDMAYEPLIEAVKQYLPMGEGQQLMRICVPGAGVGRLALELSALGYEVQGNEFSLHMLLASDFILNGNMCSTERQLAISPWLLESRNVHSSSNQCRKIMIPDVDPQKLIRNEQNGKPLPNFSMAAGDFASIYCDPRQSGQWGAVVCCFFLDAAPNMMDYIQIIYNMLAEEGVLINLGPLLYHWSGPAMRPDDGTYEDYQTRFDHLDKRYMTSIDLCWEDVREILVNVGFVVEEERVGVHALYTADRRSMIKMSYRCVYFVAKKRSGDSVTRDGEMSDNESNGEGSMTSE